MWWLWITNHSLAALRGSGATVKIVTLSPEMGRTEVIRAMTGAGTDQSLLLSVREWKTDTYGATGLEYGLELEALNARSLLRRRLAGAKRIEAVLKPDAAAALADLRQRTGRTYAAIIVEALLVASKR